MVDLAKPWVRREKLKTLPPPASSFELLTSVRGVGIPGHLKALRTSSFDALVRSKKVLYSSLHDEKLFKMCTVTSTSHRRLLSTRDRLHDVRRSVLGAPLPTMHSLKILDKISVSDDDQAILDSKESSFRLNGNFSFEVDADTIGRRAASSQTNTTTDSYEPFQNYTPSDEPEYTGIDAQASAPSPSPSPYNADEEEDADADADADAEPTLTIRR